MCHCKNNRFNCGCFLVASFHVWLGKTFGPDIFIEIAKVIAMLTPFVILFILVYISCEESNKKKGLDFLLLNLIE